MLQKEVSAAMEVHCGGNSDAMAKALFLDGVHALLRASCGTQT